VSHPEIGPLELEVPMIRFHRRGRWPALIAILALTACADESSLVSAVQESSAESRATAPGQAVAADFARSSPEVMALAGTVFSAVDEATGQIVFGVERRSVANEIAPIMARHGIPATRFRVTLSEPIHFAATLRDEVRPIMSGLQIHWSSYVCTLGFSVNHAGGRSFITNSHCTDQQGTTGTTQYNQPLRSTSPNAIAFEAHDPAYTRSAGCSRGKVCRTSDAARARYVEGVESYARIAKTTGENNGSLTIDGYFDITAQNNTSTSYSGTLHKVGRTTGWSSGNVSHTCATVNVSGSNIQLLCQTLVQRSGNVIVGGGDSGSPVFVRNGATEATLAGILWGGSTSGDLFVFSPLKNIIDELGSMDATKDGVGGGDGGGGGSDPNCPPGSKKRACR